MSNILTLTNMSTILPCRPHTTRPHATAPACAFLADAKIAKDRSRREGQVGRMKQSTTVLVTGANKGIGRETARRLAELGMTVLVGARDRERGEAAVKSLRANSPDDTLPRTTFESGSARGLVIRLEGLGQTMGRATYATVELSDEPDQGEQMFLREGVKISVADPPLSVVTVTSRFFWWLVRRSHARWQKRASDACRAT